MAGEIGPAAMNPSVKTLTSSFLWIALFLAPLCRAQERRAYEGVVSWKKDTIGTVILLEISSDSVSGWLRMGKPVPIEGGSVLESGVEFRAAGNRYQIDERKGRISYSGPDGEGNRFLTRLTRLTGPLQELLEETQFSGRIATLEVDGRRWALRYGSPALWKRQGPPFETFARLEELVGRKISVWVADADLRRGRIVVVEEPEGMDIPLKPPKKPKDQPKQDKK